jgi:hypothetical protein
VDLDPNDYVSYVWMYGGLSCSIWDLHLAVGAAVALCVAVALLARESDGEPPERREGRSERGG